MIKLHKFIAYVGAWLWITLGGLTISSILLGTVGWAINVVIGTLFILIGCFFYWRTHSFHRFYMANADNLRKDKLFHQHLLPETLLTLCILLFVGILLLAGMSRVFGEGYPIFG